MKHLESLSNAWLFLGGIPVIDEFHCWLRICGLINHEYITNYTAVITCKQHQVVYWLLGIFGYVATCRNVSQRLTTSHNDNNYIYCRCFFLNFLSVFINIKTHIYLLISAQFEVDNPMALTQETHIEFYEHWFRKIC